MKTLLCLALLSAGATMAQAYPNVVISYPSRNAAKVQKSEMLSVVVEKGAYSVEGRTIAPVSLVSYTNALLKSKPQGVIFVYVREGTTFGDFVRGVDQLRETDAQTIAVSSEELPLGRDP